VALLFLLQPIVRGWARLAATFADSKRRLSARETLGFAQLADRDLTLDRLAYWAEKPLDRMRFLSRLLERLGSTGMAEQTGRRLEPVRRRGLRQPLGLAPADDGLRVLSR
jgi:hypothetical protein